MKRPSRPPPVEVPEDDETLQEIEESQPRLKFVCRRPRWIVKECERVMPQYDNINDEKKYLLENCIGIKKMSLNSV
tara:strand:- start:475 stop:702 length:228 start_codon:yes stop_codon:yes gene_type:complete